MLTSSLVLVVTEVIILFSLQEIVKDLDLSSDILVMDVKDSCICYLKVYMLIRVLLEGTKLLYNHL